jgi:hypothetical protein
MLALVIVNPVSGDGSAPQLMEAHVLPFLNSHSMDYRLVTTQSADEAGSEAQLYINSKDSVHKLIVLAGGDGTVHEVVNAIVRPIVEDGTYQLDEHISLVLLPCGTANALYSSLFLPGRPIQKPNGVGDVDEATLYKLESLFAYFDVRSRMVPLTLAETKFLTKEETVQTRILSAVVTSTSLHASILHSAERLRNSIPGIDRFKAAAQENITTWYSSVAKLHSGENVPVQRYVPSKRAFQDIHLAEGGVTLNGPFVYFLSTVNVDRLEPQFVITPLYSKVRPEITSVVDYMDVVILRPGDGQTPQGYAEKLGGFFQAAYMDGKHVDAEESGIVTEYYRCGGWEWIPTVSGTSHRLECFQ